MSTESDNSLEAPLPRILIVEDDKMFRETIGEILRDEGYKVRGARSLRKAAKRLTRHQFDLVLTDFEIGDATGFDVIQIARAKLPDAKVILMSGNADAELLEQSATQGASRFISKPFTIPKLLEAIESLLNEPASDSTS